MKIVLEDNDTIIFQEKIINRNNIKYTYQCEIINEKEKKDFISGIPADMVFEAIYDTKNDIVLNDIYSYLAHYGEFEKRQSKYVLIDVKKDEKGLTLVLDGGKKITPAELYKEAMRYLQSNQAEL